MRTNLIFFILFLIISCTPKVNLELDIENLKNEGVVILQNKNLEDVTDEIRKISKTDINPIKSIADWGYPNFNSNNLIPNINLNINLSIQQDNNFFKNSTNNFYRKEIININNNIIFVDDRATLFILNENFKLVHKFQIHNLKKYKDYPLKFSLVSESDILFISDNLGSIFAYDLKNYKTLWRNELEVPFLSNLALYKNNIFVSNSNGKIYSFNTLSGKQNWSYETGTQTAKSYKAYRVSISNNKLLFSNDFGKITCIDLDKQTVLWSRTLQLSTAYQDMNLLELADFVTENNNLYITSSFGRFLKLDLNNGNILWSNNIYSATTIPIINNNSVALITDNGFLNIFDKASGKILYKKNLLNFLHMKKNKNKKNSLNNIFLLSGKFYITTNNGYVFLVNSNDLQFIEYKKLSSSINSNIAISKNAIFFVGNKDAIFKIQ
jgi:outer membrane protein assembly factor BamB